jgi:hypothetical protein
VTDVRNTQLQSKIGPYVDTFLTSMVLAELKGRAGDSNLEYRLSNSLDKTIAKIEKNQGKDGTFAGNQAWASVLSQAVCGNGLRKAKLAGAKVSDDTIARLQTQVAQSFDARTGDYRAEAAGPGGATSTAGVPLYGASQALANANDAYLANRADEKRAREIQAQPNAPPADLAWAERKIKDIDSSRQQAQQVVASVGKQLDNANFVAGFGNNGGEEFLSFMNISETLLLQGGAQWEKWDKNMTEGLTRAQDKDGSWSGHHCITGKTFCTAGALLVLMADRMPIPASVKAEPQK